MAGAGLTILPSGVLFAKETEPRVRVGFIGVGLRGQNHLDLALRRNDVEVVAICDVQQRMIDDEQRTDQKVRQTNASGNTGRTARI